jgi:hypothetical protein
VLQRKPWLQVLQEQLHERRQQRVREEELRERERLVMIKETERLKEEDLRAKVEKQLKAQQLIAEVPSSTMSAPYKGSRQYTSESGSLCMCWYVVLTV